VRQGLFRFLREIWLGLAIGIVAPLAVWGLGKVDWHASSHSHRAVAPGPPLKRPIPARSFLEHLIPPPGGRLPGVHVDTQIRRQVGKLPLERKIAQLLLVGFAGRTVKAPFYGTLGRMDLGGVAFDRDNYQSPNQISTLAAAVSNTTADPRTHTPPFIVAPQEGGDFSAFPNLPPFDNAADLHSTSLAAREARDSAKALTQVGFNGVLAPDLDVSASTDQPLAGRAFSDVPSKVASYAGATIGAYRSAHMLSAPGHFPGIGAAGQSTDNGPTEVGLGMKDLARRDLVPFRAAIRAGAPAVLLGHAGYQPDDFVVPASLSRAIATRLLRGQLGFKGVAITDDLEAGAITSQTTVPKAAVMAIEAGADMVWISSPESDWIAAYKALLAAVRAKRIPMLRIDTAVTRIVTAKRELGLKNQTRKIPPGAPGS
jgi:beta-N-acetylhexosaminidase